MKKRYIARIVFITLVWACSAFALTPDEMVEKGLFKDAVGAYEKSLPQAKNDEERGAIHREIGYVYVRQEDFIHAGKEFSLALSLNHHFPPEEKVRMAKYMAWGEMVKEAVSLLRSVISKNPGNVPARIYLGRYLSWREKYDEAIRNAEYVLMKEANNTDALLIKGDSLRWRGEYGKAAKIYEKILSGEKNFNARTGLAYTYLERGFPASALETIKTLTPKYPYQKRSLTQVKRAIRKQTRPTLTGSYSLYDDSDENRLHTMGLEYRFWINNFHSRVSAQHLQGKDSLRKNRGDIIEGGTIIPFKGNSSLGVDMGVAALKDGESSTEFTGKGDWEMAFSRGAVRVSIEREVFTDTAELIENRVRYTDGGAELSLSLSSRIFSHIGYHYRDYSDNNSSNRASGELAYSLIRGTPSLKGGYRIEYLDFRRESGSGYFDPSDFLSHQIFLALSLQGKALSLSLEPYGGYQSFRRGGQNEDDLIGGGYASLTANISDTISLKVTGEGGNFSLNTSSGFTYYQVGGAITTRF